MMVNQTPKRQAVGFLWGIGVGFVLGFFVGGQASKSIFESFESFQLPSAPPAPLEELPSFTTLLRQSGSDKFRKHHYERYYESWLEPFRRTPNFKLIEIGVLKGESLKLWKRYFSHPASLLGVGYGKTVKWEKNESDVLDVYHGDQTKDVTMKALIQRGPWDVIIDDGSHVPQHQIYTLFQLWQRAIKPGGLYIIEDLETNYWSAGSNTYGYNLTETGIGATAEYSVVTKLHELQQVLVRHQIGANDEMSIMPGDHSICNIEFGMNIVVLRKCASQYSFPRQSQTVMYDKERMQQWLKQAHRTNPQTNEQGDLLQ